MCNLGYAEPVVPDCNTVAGYAQSILDSCFVRGWNSVWTQGQVEDNDESYYVNVG